MQLRRHANVRALIALGCRPTMRLRILNWKLGFLWKLMNPQNRSISSDIFYSLKDQEPSLFSNPVYWNRSITNLTSSLLNGSSVCLKTVKKALHKAGQDYIWNKAESHKSLSLLPRTILWRKLWDHARDRGFQGTCYFESSNNTIMQ